MQVLDEQILKFPLIFHKQVLEVGQTLGHL